ncbi:ABC transporter substrate-binding protein, partial [Rhizobium ruizarguesonis]
MGPYKFESWTQGTSVVIVREDNYWGSKPASEKATYVWRRESSVAAAMVETGEADLAF